jgi:RNA polymerase sigma factor (TIGR02999 family)
MRSQMIPLAHRGFPVTTPTRRDELIAVVYNELRRIAATYLRNERPDHTLQPTALVHEAYMRIVVQEQIQWQSEEHFIGVAAMMMRRILLNHAKSHNRLKRGGGAYKIALADTDIAINDDGIDLIELDEALERLSRDHIQESQIVELRFFGGLSIAETARVLNVSESTVERDWKFARTWLLRELSKTRI